MTLSSTRDGTVTVGDMVRGSLELVHLAEGGEPLAAEDTTVALNTLRRMLRTWAVTGVRLWLNDEEIITLAASTASYTLDPRYLEISYGFRRDASGNDTPIRLMDRDEYNRLSYKASSGPPYAVFVNRLLTSTTATVYPVPTAAGEYIYLTGKRQILDPTQLTETIEVPAEWEETVVFNLAKRLLPTFPGTPDPGMIISTADELYAILEGQDRPASVRMGPARSR